MRKILYKLNSEKNTGDDEVGTFNRVKELGRIGNTTIKLHL